MELSRTIALVEPRYIFQTDKQIDFVINYENLWKREISDQSNTIWKIRPLGAWWAAINSKLVENSNKTKIENLHSTAVKQTIKHSRLVNNIL